MKLLFDHNLSPSLVHHLSDLFPESQHVFPLGLHQESDVKVWRYALAHDFTIVSKDADFSDLSTTLGLPPKVVWLQIGNSSTTDVERLLRSNYVLIRNMYDDADRGIVALVRS